MSAGMRKLAIAISIAGLMGVGLAGDAVAAPGDPVVSQVADINPGPSDSGAGSFIPIGSSVLFPASDGTHGTQLWESNGGPIGSGTSQDVINPSGDANPFGGVDAGGTLYFPADDGVHGTELWAKVPGSPAHLLENINTTGGLNGPNGSNPVSFFAVGNRAFFVADDGTHGNEVWTTDGTTTSRVSNFTGDGPPGFFTEFDSIGNTVFFNATEGTDGVELWKTDPPYTSATEVQNINPNAGEGGGPNSMAVANGDLLFAAASSGNNVELWKSAPPFTSAVLVREINTTPNACSCPSELTTIGNTVFFTASGGGPTEIWRSDPPYDSGSTNQVSSINGFNGPEDLVAGDGTLYFDDDPSNFGREVFKTTGVGATRISDVNPGSGDSDIADLFFDAGKLYFRATEPTHGEEPYVYDGNTVSLVKDINPGANPSFGGNFAAAGSTIFFTADDGTTGFEVWKIAPEPAPPGGGGGGPVTPAPPAKKKCKKHKKRKRAAAAKKKCKKRKKR